MFHNSTLKSIWETIFEIHCKFMQKSMYFLITVYSSDYRAFIVNIRSSVDPYEFIPVSRFTNGTSKILAVVFY